MDREKAWIKRALAGDQAAFSHLVEAYQAPIYNLAYRMLGNPAEAEDAAQETFVRVWTRLRTFDIERKFSSWILSIASHYCIDRLRRRRTTQVSLEDILAQQTFADPHDGPERTTLRHEAQQSVRSMMEELPAQYQAVLALRYWYDLSYAEMAEVLDTTRSAIKSRLHRARCMLAKRMRLMESHTGTPENEREAASLPMSTSTYEREAMRNALSASH